MSIEKNKKIKKIRKIKKNGEYINRYKIERRKKFEKILDVIYPQVCGICGKLNRESLCNKCKVKLKKEYRFQIDNYEEDLSKNFVQHYYFFKYENLIRSQILSLKFQEKPYVYKTIEYFVKNMQKSFENLKKYDIIIIVPISRQRKKERGYNQTYIITKEISKMLEIPILNNVLYKIKNTIPQSSLNKQQREENIKGVYKANNIERLYNKKILILDDIYTTGNTVNECANIFVQKGINRENIGVLTIAKD